MSKTEAINENLSAFCRICLKIPNSRQITGLFDTKEDIIPASVISNLANIEVLKGDELPQNLCNVCWKRVSSTLGFVKEIQESDKWLRMQLKVKSEAEEAILVENIKEEEPFDIVEDEIFEKKPKPKSKSHQEPRCCMCRFICSSPEALEHHVKTSHPDPKHKNIENHKAITCNFCYKGFQNHRSYADHFRKPYIDRVHQCSQCGQTFAYASDLQHHELTHVETKNIECPVCQKRFRAPKNLRRHMKTHDDSSKMRCDLCGALFAEKKQLEYHIKSHINARDCLCTVCGKGFVHNNLLKLHMRKHTGERPHKCDICGKAYKHNTDLRRHKYEHEGVKPFKCGFCERTFYQRSNMKVHERVHTGDMPFSCSLCGQKFKFYAHWKTHEKKHQERVTEIMVTS
ncbi:zinc finger protein 771-like [Culicoides brevitarsis]|uniref:zinc finger protein 771-like n=1 Tax=Culicoides brevitarsis TaxID=469753 RepID=UPI00307B7D73